MIPATGYSCAVLLRPGNAPASRGVRGLRRRLIDLLRLAFPKARVLVRLDGGFATPEIFDLLDAEPRVDYIVAMVANAVLARAAEPAMVEPARGATPVGGPNTSTPRPAMPRGRGLARVA